MFDTTDAKFVKKGWGFELWIHNDPRYCGKLLHFDEGKSCSLHYHKLKHETFYLESGVLECRFASLDVLKMADTIKLDYDDMNWFTMRAGDIKEIPPLLVHQMRAVGGPARLFEFSTEHFDSDSYRIIKGD
jgi:hypothetical protein